MARIELMVERTSLIFNLIELNKIIKCLLTFFITKLNNFYLCV